MSFGTVIYIWLSRCTGSYVSLCLASVIYAKLYQTDFQVVVPVYFPISNVWEFQLFPSHQFLMLSILKFSCPGEYTIVSMVFICSLITNEVENFFVCLFAIWISSFVTWIFRHIKHYFYWDICLFSNW